MHDLNLDFLGFKTWYAWRKYSDNLGFLLRKSKSLHHCQTKLKNICLSKVVTGDSVAAQILLDVRGRHFIGEDTRNPPELLVRLAKLCEKEALPLLLCCNASAYNEIWENSDINWKGEYLYAFILSYI